MFARTEWTPKWPPVGRAQTLDASIIVVFPAPLAAKHYDEHMETRGFLRIEGERLDERMGRCIQVSGN
jgi:hypothetical protein